MAGLISRLMEGFMLRWTRALQSMARRLSIASPEFSMALRYLTASRNPLHIFDLQLTVGYQNNEVRFKFDPSFGISYLYNKIGEIFRLNEGTFRLEWLDSLSVWIIFEEEDDLDCCLYLLESFRSRSLVIRVFDQ